MVTCKIFYYKALEEPIQWNIKHAHFNKNPPTEEKELELSMPQTKFNEWYVHLYSHEIEGPFTQSILDDVFALFNDNDKNPLGNQTYQTLIRANRLHTSMSVGDILYIEDTKTWYVVCGLGFAKLVFSD